MCGTSDVSSSPTSPSVLEEEQSEVHGETEKEGETETEGETEEETEETEEPTNQSQPQPCPPFRPKIHSRKFRE